MKVTIFQVPYDSGNRGVRMGAGPEHFVQNGAAPALRARGHEVEVSRVEAPEGFRAEIKTAIELCRALAERVSAAQAEGRFPVVLSGNCNSSLGALGGLGADDLGLIWFDAHGDFNDPETSESGFFDGMGMAMATGRCWRRLAASIPGFRPLPEANVIHVGVRDLDAEERARLERSDVQFVKAESVRQDGVGAALGPALGKLRARVSKIYLHVDLDVLDSSETPANEYGARIPGGLATAQVLEAIRLTAARLRVCGAGLASYDPSYDPEGRTLQAGMSFMAAALDGAAFAFDARLD